jgi:hypothetical protein
MKDVFALRDRFAIEEAKRILKEDLGYENIAGQAYEFAEEMMIERAKYDEDSEKSQNIGECESATMTKSEDKKECKKCGIYHFSGEQLHDAQVENDRLALIQERAVLGYLILNLPNNMLALMNKTGINENHFQGSNATIFLYVSFLVLCDDKTNDFSDLIYCMRKDGDLGEIGGEAEIFNIMKEAPGDDFNFANACRMIIESSILRERLRSDILRV